MTGLPHGWRRVRWGDIATLEYGKGLRDYRDSLGTTPVFGTNGPVGVTEAEPLCDEPGVIVGRKGAYRGIHYSNRPFYVIDTAFYLKPIASIDPRWAYYELLTHDINAMDSGSAIPSTSRPSFYAMDVDVPSLAEQRAIARMLGALDDKIGSNHRLSETCRELVRLELDAREVGNWPEVPVSRLARFVNGGAYTKGASGTGRMVVRIADLTKGAGGSTVYNDIDVPDDRVARAGDLLMAWSGSLGIHVWLGEEAIVNQHIFKVVPENVPPWLVFDRIEQVMPEFRQIAADKATTMGHIKRHHLDDARVRVPVGSDVDELDQLLSPHWSRALAADLESRTLAELRDALLPELLSGRMRVPVAEELVGAPT